MQCVAAWWRLLGPGDFGHPGHRSGVLGSGQEVGAAEALSIGQLAHQLQQVHAGARRLLREKLPRVLVVPNQGFGGSNVSVVLSKADECFPSFPTVLSHFFRINISAETLIIMGKLEISHVEKCTIQEGLEIEKKIGTKEKVHD